MIAVFLFYNKTYGVSDKFSFSKDLKHCNVLTFDGIGYVLTTLDSTGVSSKSIKIDNLSKFLRRLPGLMPELSSIISTYVHNREPKRWLPLSINSCNEVARNTGGVDVPITFNVASLHAYLKWFDSKRNYDIDYKWRRK